MADKSSIKTNVKQFVTNKQTSSTFILIITIMFVLTLNALLPLLEGGAHYTEEATEYLYYEYKELHESNDHYVLTYKSQMEIMLYKVSYRDQNKDLTIEELYNIDAPDNFVVSVYTKFFFQSTSWYITVALQIISIILIFYSLFNYLLVRHKIRYKKFVDLDEEVTLLAQSKLDPITFEPWMVDKFNIPRKIKQHKTNVQYKLEKLEKRTSYKTRLAYKDYLKQLDDYNAKMDNLIKINNKIHNISENIDTTNDDIELPYVETGVSVLIAPVPKRRVKKYMLKKSKLEYYLSDEYITNYVISGKVKHFKFIHPTFVLCGVNLHGATSDSYSLIESDSKRIGRQSIGRVIRLTAMSVIFALLTTITVMSSLEQSWQWIVINVLTKVLPLLFQVLNAYNYRNNFMNTQLIPNLQARRTIAYLYLADTK